ncbi:MAG: hypothetical protein O9325_11010 [Roseomonas sp.]|nr:hypothetical protein [Roseomonas sp.]
MVEKPLGCGLGEVISVVARRRRWTLEQKLALVEGGRGLARRSRQWRTGTG